MSVAHPSLELVNLIVDTGSSNTWVGATTEYDPTSSATDTGEEVVHIVIPFTRKIMLTR